MIDQKSGRGIDGLVELLGGLGTDGAVGPNLFEPPAGIVGLRLALLPLILPVVLEPIPHLLEETLEGMP